MYKYNFVVYYYFINYYHRCMVNKMTTGIYLFNRKFDLPAPFRKSDWESVTKVKMPSKKKLAKAKVTKEQFLAELEEYFDDTYNNGAFDVTSYANVFVRRGYIFIKITYIGHF